MSAVFTDFPDSTRPRTSPPRPRLNIGAILDIIQPGHELRAARLQSILDELDELRHNEDRDGYKFRPTPYALEHARRWTITAHSVTEAELPPPEFTPDGEGGVDIQWLAGGREVCLSCRAFPTLKGNYIYWQGGDEYGAKSVNLHGLLESFRWLLDANR